MHLMPCSALSPAALLAALALVAVFAACSGGEADNPATVTAAAKLGKQIFDDPNLSASGKLACAGCHLATKAHASNATVNLGGPNMDQSGNRNAPSLDYLDLTPAFFFDGAGRPTGGFNRDGRADNRIGQASRPFLSAREMANATPAAVVAKLRVAAYAEDFRSLFGSRIFEQGDEAFERALFALAAYQREDASFHLFNSSYDAFLSGKAVLSAQQLRGLALYNNPQKGNCAACHPSARGANGEPPLFTDFSYDNLGVPRNADIPANADASTFDLGLCGPDRSDLADRADLCGAFKVPTLRNIALTAPYFHNGKFATLEQAVRFYVRRDTNPGEWYPPNADGTANKFDDLPEAYKGNVNTSEVPYNRHVGDQPALSDAEVLDVVAFLQTLTDGTAP